MKRAWFVVEGELPIPACVHGPYESELEASKLCENAIAQGCIARVFSGDATDADERRGRLLRKATEARR